MKRCEVHKYQWSGPDFAFECPQCTIATQREQLRQLAEAVMEAQRQIEELNGYDRGECPTDYHDAVKLSRAILKE